MWDTAGREWNRGREAESHDPYARTVEVYRAISTPPVELVQGVPR